MRLLLLTLPLLVASVKGAPTSSPDLFSLRKSTDTVPNVQWRKMMGLWYEGIHSPGSTKERCTIRKYEGLVQGASELLFFILSASRFGSESGPVNFTELYVYHGREREVNDGKLMQWSAESDVHIVNEYWIYKVGPEVKPVPIHDDNSVWGENPFASQYEYAIVSNYIKYPVTVLVRDPQVFRQKYETEVMRWLEYRGFGGSWMREPLLRPVDHSSCHYEEAVFQRLINP